VRHRRIVGEDSKSVGEGREHVERAGVYEGNSGRRHE
jgi:hypothetical protein